MAEQLADKIHAFFTAYPVREFDPGEMMVHAEEDPAGVFYLLEGRVNQYDISPTGTTVVVNVFKPPAFFPMSWAMNKTPNHYFFETATKVRAHVAPADAAVQFLRDNPDVLFDLLGRVYRGTDGLLRRMAHLMGGDARSRLVFELMNAAHRFGEHRLDGSVAVPIKEGELARLSGMARETVNRTLQGLKAAGLVEVTRSGFVLHDMRALEASLGNEL
jgi:CRP/FNR family transcriptional regulator, cyclic AMP receptor protein